MPEALLLLNSLFPNHKIYIGEIRNMANIRNMKRIVIIPDSFKGTLSSGEVCDIEEEVLKKAFPEWDIVKLPVADGGEGTVECFLSILQGERVSVTVQNAFGDDIECYYGRFGNRAVIEMAQCAGMISNHRRDPMSASTYGVGQMIHHAVNSGCSEVLLGLGGSCTNDCDAGMAAALGTKFYDAEGKEFIPAGGDLKNVVSIDNSAAAEKLAGIRITCMCDITNPLYGPKGAAYVFAPQKGADEIQVKELDDNLRAFAKSIKRDLSVGVQNIPGGGAAGGMGAGAVAFLGAGLKGGIDYILDTIDCYSRIAGADYIITGEGRFDGQSLDGKVVSGVAKRAASVGIPVIIVAGCADKSARVPDNVCGLFTASEEGRPIDEIAKSCRTDLTDAMNRVVEFIKLSSM